MTKQIPLTQGKFAIVDDEDYERITRWKWCAGKGGDTFYATRCPGKRNTTIAMHRLIIGASGRQQIDHVNGNGLDNRRCNLRLATKSQNMMNRGPQKGNKSGYKGVHFDLASGKWMAIIKFDGRNRNLGRFNTKEQAAQAYNKAAQEHFGTFAWLNKIKSTQGVG